MPEGPVAGEVDAARRDDHRQQHTGQHILSRAFVDTAGADTVGFHLGAERCTVDLDREDLDEASLAAAEARANAVVLADVPVTAAWYPDRSALPEGLRKEAAVEGPVRVVSVGDFDANACCGTHCVRSGQVGPIKVLRTERKKGGIRVEFVCGGRALADYGRRHRALREAALLLTTEELEVPERVAAMLAEGKALRSRLERSESELRERVIEALALEPAEPGEGLLARDLGPDRTGWLTAAAGALAARRNAPVLLVSAAGAEARAALALPPGAPGHAGRALTTLLREAGGRGGGSDRLAQGKLPAAGAAGLLERARAGGIPREETAS